MQINMQSVFFTLALEIGNNQAEWQNGTIHTPHSRPSTFDRDLYVCECFENDDETSEQRSGQTIQHKQMTKNNGLSNAVIFARFVSHSIAADFDANYKWMTEWSKERTSERTKTHNGTTAATAIFKCMQKCTKREKLHCAKQGDRLRLLCDKSRCFARTIHDAYTICALQNQFDSVINTPSHQGHRSRARIISTRSAHQRPKRQMFECYVIHSCPPIRP